MSTKKILLITGDFTEDYETMIPFQMLTMIGYKVHAVCPNKKKGDFIKTAIHDFEGDQTYTEKLGHLFQLNFSFSEVNLENYEALVITGGRAPEYLRLNKNVLKMVNYFSTEQKPIAAICHGIQLLTAADAVKGKKLTAYPTVEPEITMAGGRYIKVEPTEAVIDDVLVTSPAWPGHPKWIASFLKILGTEIKI